MRAHGRERSVGGHRKGAGERLDRQGFYGKKPPEQMENKRY